MRCNVQDQMIASALFFRDTLPGLFQAPDVKNFSASS